MVSTNSLFVDTIVHAHFSAQILPADGQNLTKPTAQKSVDATRNFFNRTGTVNFNKC